MPTVRCESCGQKMTAPDVYMGRTVKCPKCKQPLLVTDGVAGAPPLAVAASAASQGGATAVAAPVAARAANGSIGEGTASFAAPTVIHSAAAPSVSPPMTMLSPRELLQSHPKTAAATALSFLWALIALAMAMTQVGDKHSGGMALWNLGLAGAWAALGVGLYRRALNAYLIGIAANALMAVVLVFQIGDGGGSPLLLLVISAVVLALLFAEAKAIRAAYAANPAAPSSAVVVPIARRASPPVPVHPVPEKRGRDRAPNLRTNSKAMFWLFLCLLGGFTLYALQQPLRFELPHFLMNFLSLSALGGGLFAMIYLWRNFGAIGQQPKPYAAYGLLGGIGMIVLFLLSLVAIVVSEIPAFHKSGGHRSEGASTVSFAEFDGKFGASAIEKGRAEPREQQTTAQAEAELKTYLGRTAHWQGTVLDVQGTDVYLAVGSSTTDQIINNNLEEAARRQIAREEGLIGQDVVQVLLKLGEQDASKATGLSKGQHLNYSGTLAGIGNPYPYVLSDGRIE